MTGLNNWGGRKKRAAHSAATDRDFAKNSAKGNDRQQGKKRNEK
jgi:hypothetical protein